MLKREDLIEGTFILSNYQTVSKKKELGIIKNVSGDRNSPHADPEELRYDIFYPASEITVKDIRDNSGVSAEAIILAPEKAELWMKDRFVKNEAKILKLRNRNFALKSSFEDIFTKALSLM